MPPTAALFVPCYVDQLMPEIGIAVVRVLEKVGCKVMVPPGQTCCGQPAFNCGYHVESRAVAEHFLRTFADCEHIVVPSGSCAAMVKVFYRELFAGTPSAEAAARVAANTWEFSTFLVERLGVTELGASWPGRASFHDGCHGLRELGIATAPRRLLAKVHGLELVEMDEARTCCGFGGTFAVKFPDISCAMAEVKCAAAVKTGASTVISGDPSCMLHLRGYAEKQRQELTFLHLAQVLAD